jgi:hypothetical protein
MNIGRLARVPALCGVAALAMVSLVACGPQKPDDVTPPDAPIMLSLEIPSDTFGIGYSGVTPAVLPVAPTATTAGITANYFVLPLITTTSPIVRAVLRSPYPSELAVTATDVGRGGAPVTLPKLASGSPMPATGAFQVIGVTPNDPTTATWTIVIRYPDSFQGSKLIRTGISDVFGALTTTPLSSPPLVYSMSFRGSTVTVAIASTAAGSDGRITSTPPGIDCPGTCTADFTTTTSVVLSEGVLHNSTEFTGWTGGCVGSGNICSVSLRAPGPRIIPVNPATVTANFRTHANTAVAPASTCAAPAAIMGMSFVGTPNCGMPAPLGATPGCDASGWFCCGVSGATPTAHCPGGNETPAGCGADGLGVFAGRGRLIQPWGCYESSP